MIPSIVARQTRETVLDYLRTTFALADPDFEDALFSFLDGEDGLFKGPYIDLRLPFRTAGGDERIPLDIRPGFDPYQHQLKAFRRLYSMGGHQPQNTLVTTGTGSGKTECFLYPILDHCVRNLEKPGIKAIILYPMNALASDQARRLAQMLWDDGRLKGKVTAGLYVGGKGAHGAADRDHLVDQRDVLRASPPDILLTNYKMLDFLLLRPDDQRLWKHNGPETLRYLVLDELHTYDGAQGTDVACLIRRLKLRLQCAPGTVCAVGTSATIGGGKRQEAVQKLTEFASKVFDEDFFEDSVITETRLTAAETLGEVVDIETFPTPAHVGELDPAAYGDAESWLHRQMELWLGEGASSLSEVELAQRLERHDFLRQILKVMDGGLKSWPELDAGLLPRVPEWESFDADGRQRLLESLLGIVSHARRAAPSDEDPERMAPFLTVQIQLWLRELRSLVQRLSPAGEPLVFSWADDGLRRNQTEIDHWFPIGHCRECGTSGLASFQRAAEQVLQTDLRAIGQNWFNQSPTCRFVAFGRAGSLEMGSLPVYLCPGCNRLLHGGGDGEGEGDVVCDQCCVPTLDGSGSEPRATLPIRLSHEHSEQLPPRFLAKCPDCGTDRSLSILGSRAPSLLSVSISHLYQSDFNSDKKLLAFTDSVQDASHRAGFFGARTYRFNLRTAIQKVIDENAATGTPLAELGERVWEFWEQEFSRQGRVEKLIPTLLPQDLRELATYKTFEERAGAGKHQELENQLRERLSWEAILEYGLNARVGRTLETTHCSTVEVDLEKIGEAAEKLSLELRENSPLDQPLTPLPTQEVLEHFLGGMLNRMRLRGGIEHPFLQAYIREGGKPFFLTKSRQPLISPFGPRSVLPRFLSDLTRPPGRDLVFDTFIGRGRAPYTWYQDWVQRCLGVDPKDPGIHDIYREAVGYLEQTGLLVPHSLSNNKQAWGLDPQYLVATPGASEVVCPTCRRRVALSEREATLWEGGTCTQYRCRGVFERSADPRSTYYGRIYRSGRLERIFSQEHTGLLERGKREQLEEDFKNGTRPGAPNLFVSTPTLELGIDIGDLSAAVLCSVPPTTPNYLQRIGRTGRSTGNAFCLTLANSRPHDLYFHAEPLEMMAGQVLPPGCFLDAPEMLRRQIAAHAMDAWAREETELTALPNKTGRVLSSAGGEQFPGRFLQYYRSNRVDLTRQFLASFGTYLSSTNHQRLSDFGNGDRVPELIEETFRQVKTEIADLRAHQKRAKRRIQEIENAPDSSGDPDGEMLELEETRKVLARLVEELQNKYPLNVLTDDGVLPNYAFPEPGVKLESVVAEKRSNGPPDYRGREYTRPASSAIRELAPFNTFYADGRKVKVNEIDIGSRAQPLIEMWRLCTACSYARTELADQEMEPACPRCSDAGWSDAGQARRLVHFRRSRSLSTSLEASTSDETDERENEFYDVLDLIDVGPDNFNGARLIESLPFGYELLKDLSLREFNFGLEGRPGQGGLRVRGENVGDKGFDVCLDCGRVRDERAGGGEIRHQPACRARKLGVQEESEPVFLFREVVSEALRILLPVSEVDLDSKRASFRAALQLGFRRHFEGDPGHLIVRSVPEPVRGGHGIRQFLVVFDGVPGGTGYLSELWESGQFIDVLEKSLGALQTCRCQQDPDRDGCYRCLFAYQNQRDLPLVSSKLAQALLRSILAAKETLKNVPTLSEVTLETQLESELEAKFLAALKKRVGSTRGLVWEENIRQGKEVWLIRGLETTWEIQAQASVGPAQGVFPMSRPDFLIRTENADPAIRPVAVFCDGFAYHACPDQDIARIGDDIEKRMGIIRSERYVVWSVAWKDVVDFEEGENHNTCRTLFADLGSGQLNQVGGLHGLTLGTEIGRRGSMEMLWSYLVDPDLQEWEKLADSYAFTWINTPNQWMSPEAGANLEDRLEEEEDHFLPGPVAQVGRDESALTHVVWRDWLVLLSRGARATLVAGKVDRLVLRLFDQKIQRNDGTFEADWRAFLHAWNLLQFHEGLSVVSSELIAAGQYDRSEPETASLVADSTGVDYGAAPPGGALESILEYATEAAEPLIRACSAAGIALPENGCELTQDGNRCGPEAELAWPELRVAVLAERQAEDRSEFENAGWSVLVHPLAPREVIAELKNRSGTVGSEPEANDG